MAGTASTTGQHHFIFGTLAVAVIMAAYLVLNAPSASEDKARPWSEYPAFTAVESQDMLLLTSNREIPAQTMEETGTRNQEIVLAMADPDAGGEFMVSPPSRPAGEAPESQVDTSPDSSQDSSQAPDDGLTAFVRDQEWTIATVRKGDTLSQLFNRHDLNSTTAYRIAELEDAAPLLKIRPGQEIWLKKSETGGLGLLSYSMDSFTDLTIVPSEASFEVILETREPEIRINNAKAVINSSLLGASSGAGVSLNTMYNFIAMFGWQVDFSMDLQKGDRFSVIYEELYLDEEKVGDGDIVAAEMVVSGKRYRAVRHVDEEGVANYYAPDGQGIKGTFLRSPLKFGYITSNFSKRRLHPIKKVWRAHNGVDYGAPRGTPIMATGDGSVEFAGRKNGYGKTVIIRHGGTYKTLYAHLSGYAKGIKSGARVSQGDIIGYVGATGLATGPHLHYEFQVNGIHKNPVTVKFPKSQSIDERYLADFKRSAGIWVAELEYLDSIPVAQN